ncbi:TPA: hypothetical protein QB457_001946, partial [Pasteurella multocida]|nr:hypothetical protein [Pasteurella multocida]
KEIKKDIQSFAKERWEKDESITRNNIIKNFKEGRNVSEQEETLKNWLAEIDPVTKRGAKRLRNGKIIEPKNNLRK